MPSSSINATPGELHHVVALEQFAPDVAVELAVAADTGGFAGTVVGDRFQPWLPSQGNASFAWAVLGAIGQQTDGMVTASAVPGYRMHPATVAQASATLAVLYPDRHRLILSAGDAIDEHVVGRYWPEASERAARLFDAAEVIRKLFAASAKGNDTRHTGPHFRLESSRLWTMPASPPMMQVWAGGPMTARRAGRTLDGMVVQAGPAERLAALLNAFREGRREAGRSAGPAQTVVHAQLSWAHTDDEAMVQALRDWPMAGLRFPEVISVLRSTPISSRVPSRRTTFAHAFPSHPTRKFIAPTCSHSSISDSMPCMCTTSGAVRRLHGSRSPAVRSSRNW